MSAKILVVDDSEMMAKMIENHLQAEGYEVETAADGPSALTLAERWKPDLILLDVMMPEMDGFQVSKELRGIESTATVPIIMLTAEATIEAKKKGFAAGADDYITKPFEPAELKMRIAAHLKRAQMVAPEKTGLGRVIAIFCLRGGSGCTSLAVNLAIGLGRLWGAPASLVDLALPVGVCDSMLNQKLRYRLDDLVAMPIEELDEGVIDGFLSREASVRLLGGFEDPVRAEQLSENLTSFILEKLQESYDHIVLDLAHDFSPPTIAALDRADSILMPITPDINAARLALAALKVFESLGYREAPFLIQNRTFPKHGIHRAQLEKFLKQPIQMLIPYAEGIWSDAINKGVPLIYMDPDSPVVALFEDLAWHLSDPRMRQEKPTEPTSTWRRVAKRVGQK